MVSPERVYRLAAAFSTTRSRRIMSIPINANPIAKTDKSVRLLPPQAKQKEFGQIISYQHSSRPCIHRFSTLDSGRGAITHPRTHRS